MIFDGRIWRNVPAGAHPLNFEYLITAEGYTGVFAVEVSEARPTSDLTALATILAAQFATLIGPSDQRATEAVQA